MGKVEPDSLKLKDFLKDSLERTGNQIRESTRDEYGSAMMDFIKKIGNMDYRKVTLAHVEIYRQTCLDKGNTPATVTKKLKHLKRLFQLAANRKQLYENPFKHIDMPKSRKKKIRVNCTWNDVDFEQQVINVTPKENAKKTWCWDIKDADERTLPLTDEVTQLLVDRQNRQPEGLSLRICSSCKV